MTRFFLVVGVVIVVLFAVFSPSDVFASIEGNRLESKVMYVEDVMRVEIYRKITDSSAHIEVRNTVGYIEDHDRYQIEIMFPASTLGAGRILKYNDFYCFEIEDRYVLGYGMMQVITCRAPWALEGATIDIEYDPWEPIDLVVVVRDTDLETKKVYEVDHTIRFPSVLLYETRRTTHEGKSAWEVTIRPETSISVRVKARPDSTVTQLFPGYEIGKTPPVSEPQCYPPGEDGRRYCPNYGIGADPLRFLVHDIPEDSYGVFFDAWVEDPDSPNPEDLYTIGPLGLKPVFIPILRR